MARAKRKGRTGRSMRPVVLVATRKGAWIFRGDSGRRSWRADGPHFLGQVIHHMVLDPRDGRTLLAAAKTGHLGPDRLPVARPRTHLEGSGRPPAFPKGRGGREGAHRRPHLLAHARPPVPAGDVVRRNLAPRALPLRGRGGELGAGPGPERRLALPGVDGGATGRHAGRAQAPLGDRRPARPGAPLRGHVERRCPRVAGRGGELEASRARDGGRRGASIPQTSRSTTRTACASRRRIPIASTSRTTAASTGSTGRGRSGYASARPCPAPWETSDSPWWFTLATPTPRGSSPWTGPRSGPGPAPGGARRPTGRAMADRPGADLTADSRAGTPGGR